MNSLEIVNGWTLGGFSEVADIIYPRVASFDVFELRHSHGFAKAAYIVLFEHVFHAQEILDRHVGFQALGNSGLSICGL